LVCYFLATSLLPEAGVNFALKKALTLCFLTKMEEVMNSVVQFIRSLFFVAFMMGAAGTLVEATGCVGREAAKAHQHGGMSFRWLNNQLVDGGK
jgi:hypothetical protein